MYAYAHIMDTPKLEAEIDDRPTGFRLSILQLSSRLWICLKFYSRNSILMTFGLINTEHSPLVSNKMTELV